MQVCKNENKLFPYSLGKVKTGSPIEYLHFQKEGNNSIFVKVRQPVGQPLH